MVAAPLPPAHAKAATAGSPKVVTSYSAATASASCWVGECTSYWASADAPTGSAASELETMSAVAQLGPGLATSTVNIRWSGSAAIGPTTQVVYRVRIARAELVQPLTAGRQMRGRFQVRGSASKGAHALCRYEQEAPFPEGETTVDLVAGTTTTVIEDAVVEVTGTCSSTDASKANFAVHLTVADSLGMSGTGPGVARSSYTLRLESITIG